MEWDDSPIDYGAELLQLHDALDELGPIAPGEIMPSLCWSGHGDQWVVEDEGSRFSGLDFEVAVLMVIARAKDRILRS